MSATRSEEDIVGHAAPTVAGLSAGGQISLSRPARSVMRALGRSVFVAAAGSAIALGGAAAAAAQPGVVSAQSGSSVDVDGTQGTMVPALTGDQRTMTTQASDGHTITSDACYGRPHKGCLPPSSFDPTTISATTGISNDPDSVLDPDGYQTNQS